MNLMLFCCFLSRSVGLGELRFGFKTTVADTHLIRWIKDYTGHTHSFPGFRGAPRRFLVADDARLFSLTSVLALAFSPHFCARNSMIAIEFSS
jgi:hypothetical protein